MAASLLKNWMLMSVRLKKLKNIFPACSDLRMNELWALSKIEHATRASGCIGNTEIQEALHITKSAVSQMIDSLVEKGYVNRYPDASDRRRMCVTLTPDGMRVVQRVNSNANRLANTVTERMGEEKLGLMFDLMNEFIDNIFEAQGDMQISDPSAACGQDDENR